jgi:hypothetical protein
MPYRASPMAHCLVEGINFRREGLRYGFVADLPALEIGAEK